jgi:phospholipase C
MAIRRIGTFAMVLAIAGCSGGTGSSVTGMPLAAPLATSEARATPIRHIVFVIQENRSFNNLFMGFPGATTQRYGYDEYGDTIALQPIGLVTDWDLAHDAIGFFAACNGSGKLPGTDCKMNGWNGELATRGHPANPAYAYVPRSEIRPYWTIAREYVLADQTFASNLDGSFVAHQYAVAAFASRAVNYPLSAWGCEGGPKDTVATLTEQRVVGPSVPACFRNPTIAGEADSAGVTWRFYAGAIGGDGGFWSSYQADRNIYTGPDWKADVISPQSAFLTDVAKGKLADVTWIAPTFEASDHAVLNHGEGPSWVASVVNAVGTSSFWKSTAIFVIWDDWGGWFDPVPPIHEDYDGLGFRVPLLIVSPYAKQGYVSHVQYETSSVLRFIEDNFGLPPLAKSDTRANDPATDAFDYAQKPRAFKRIPGDKPAAYWMQLERSSWVRGRPAHILGDD